MEPKIELEQYIKEISYLKMLLKDKDKIIKLYEEKIKELENKLEKISKINQELLRKVENNITTPFFYGLYDFSSFNIKTKFP